MNRIYTPEDVARLSELIRPYLTERRYEHTLAVAEEAEVLGRVYLPDRIYELKLAALLHDITRRDDLTKQLQYCEKFGIIIDSGKILSKEVLHSVTAPAVAQHNFPDYVNDEILSAIRYHTTGSDKMSLFDCIIFLADETEPTRSHESCQKVRRYIHSRLDNGDDKTKVLHDTMILSFDSTIRYLLDKGFQIDKDTVFARNHFVELREKTH